jgi:hypothetical protein
METWKVIRSYLGLGNGEPCRSCGNPIPSGDIFGRSEGVCQTCRFDTVMRDRAA